MKASVRSIYLVLSVLFCAANAFAVSAYASMAERVPCCPKIDMLLRDAVNGGLISGGVVLVGDSRNDLIRTAFGKLSGAADAMPLQAASLFDVASLTKVVATAPAILKLVEERKLNLADPLGRWFPEFPSSGKNGIRVIHLLTHTSGLRDGCLAAHESLQKVIGCISASKVKDRPGTRFQYADINFILLGELVKRASGLPLDAYARVHLFEPLDMRDTVFNPEERFLSRCAATISRDNSIQYGRVQDPAAFALGGIAGHAGLFSTADDLASFCRMILNRGMFEGRRVLSPESVMQMTAPSFSQDGKILRGLGWDILSPFSSPRGTAFSARSFGHTGFSGSSVWIDPETGIFVIFLSSRLEHRRTKEFNRLRGDLSDAAVSTLRYGPETHDFARKSE